MNTHPLTNALLALLHIIVVATVMFYGPQIVQVEESILLPVAFLSLFVLSAAVMGFLFLYQPARLYFEGEKKGAVRFFLKTLVWFAVLVVVLFAVLLLTSVAR